MSRLVLIDTNVILRHLLNDHDRQSQAATALFAAADRREITLRLLSSVLCECVFVLESYYKHSRGDIAGVLKGLLASAGIQLADPAIHTAALDRYAKSKADFIDCLLAAFASAAPCPVASFDSDFAKFGDVQVFNPPNG